ncbi:MAG TPA: sulfite exporter TauE/SafE family protein [Acidimicrobiales bacterium]|nr:sulfite exporter TauE/SafE family protein [Acidimicrobiales bacterium]
MHVTLLDQLAAGGASLVAGAVNALAGGGTLISFPTLVALGVPAVSANITNTVSILPGYLAGSYAQRDDLRDQLASARVLAGVAAAGGLAGAVLLVLIPGHAFRQAVPYLILLSCVLLAVGDRLKPRRPPVERPAEQRGAPTTALHTRHSLVFLAAVFVAAAYGGFFGAGLGIILLAVMGIFLDESLTRINALKQGLSFVVNLLAAVFLAFSGKVTWALVPVMAVASVAGGLAGGRLVRRIDGDQLRKVVVVAGLGVAVYFFAA